jgi:uracil-DNA glycosylase family 4
VTEQLDLLPPIDGRNPKCRMCDLHKGQSNVCVWGVGPTKAKIMIVGEAPSEREAQAGRPFGGRSGQLLLEELRKAGIASDEVYFTHAVKCRPPDNRPPKTKEQKTCKPYLEAELASIKPKYVLTLGNPATKAVFKRAKITEVHGQILSTDEGIVGMPMFSPSYLLRDVTKLPIFRADLRRFVDMTRGTKQKVSVDWGLITPGTIDEFLAQLRRSKYFSFDIETDRLFPHHKRKGKITCISFCVDSTYKAWVLPLNMPGSPWSGYDRQKEILESIRSVARGKKGVGQFAKFDNLWLTEKYGIKFHLDFDTGLAHHTLDENLNHDLKGNATYYLNAPHYDLSTKEKQGHVEPMKLYRYGAYDAYYTLKLKDVFLPMLEKDPLVKRLFYRLVMRAARAFHYVDGNGLFINRKRFDESEAKVRAELTEVRKKLDDMVMAVRRKKKGPIRKPNWNAPAQVAEVLFGDFGLEPVEFTPTGAPSTAEATLVAIKDQHPVANLLVRYRELEKFLGTYIEGWKEFMYGDRVFFSTKLHGTVTGRYSSRLHQTPRDGTIRNVVDAPPGWTFVQGDFSQAELRVAAIAAREPELIKCFNDGIDVHWRTLLHVVLAGGGGEYVQPVRDTAKKLSGKTLPLPIAVEWLLKAGHEKCIEIWKGWKEGRKKAKGINFGFVYGMREEKFIEYAKLKYGFEPTMEEAETIRTAYFSLYRGLAPWHERQKKLVAVDGHVRALSGRLRRLPGINSKDRSVRSECERQAINSPIQGFIGDLKAMALVELVEKLDRDDARVVGEVHDSILFWVRTEVLEPQLRKIAKIMAHPELIDEFNIRLPVAIETELEVGPWGAGKKWTAAA